MAVVIENGRDGGVTPVPLGWSLSAERFRLHSHAERGNDELVITDRIQGLKARAARPTAEASKPGTAASGNRVFANPARLESRSTVAGRGLQPRPKRLKGDDMAVVIENGRDGGATPVPLGWSLSAERFRLHSHAERGNDELVITDRIQSLKARAARPTAEASKPGTAASGNRVFANPARFLR